MLDIIKVIVCILLGVPFMFHFLMDLYFLTYPEDEDLFNNLGKK